MALAIQEHAVDDDVRRITSQDDAKDAFEIVHAPDLLPIALSNPSEVREPVKAASPSRPSCSRLDHLLQFAASKPLKDAMLSVQVL